MLIDVPSHPHRILFRVQSFFTIEEPRAGYRLSFDQAAKGTCDEIVCEGTGNFLTYSAMAGIIEI
jgi:hypothetical protein